MREHVGVGLAEHRPVGHAVVGQLLVPHRLAQPVHVARDVRGGHVVEDRAAAPGARARRGSGPRPSRSRPPRPSVGKGNGVKAASHCFGVPKHRSGLLRMMPRGSNPTMSNRSRTSWVKRNWAASTAKSTPEPPGPPGIDEDRALTQRRVRRREPHHRDRDLRAVRPVVVERDADRRALEGAVGPEAGAPDGLALRRRLGGAGRACDKSGKQQCGRDRDGDQASLCAHGGLGNRRWRTWPRDDRPVPPPRQRPNQSALSRCRSSTGRCVGHPCCA